MVCGLVVYAGGVCVRPSSHPPHTPFSTARIPKAFSPSTSNMALLMPKPSAAGDDSTSLTRQPLRSANLGDGRSGEGKGGVTLTISRQGRRITDAPRDRTDGLW